MNQSRQDLAHYGILGMRWGIRRERGPDGRVIQSGGKRTPKAPRRQVAEDARRAHALRKRHSDELTDAEIRQLVARLELEKRFNDLDPKGLQKGHAKAKNFLAVATTVTALYAFSQTPLVKGVTKALTDHVTRAVVTGTAKAMMG